MPKRKDKSLPVIFNWQVVDVLNPEGKICIQFHPEGLLTLKHGDLVLDLSNPRILGNLIKNHAIKRFSSYEAIKKEFDAIQSSLRQLKELDAA